MTFGTVTVASETPGLDEDRRGGKSESAYRTISEVALELNLPQHVLRFWESKFKQISPLKRGGGRRYYRPQDVDLIKRIHHLLHTQGYTIKGVQKLLVKDRNLTGATSEAQNENVASAPAPVQATLPIAQTTAAAQDTIDRIMKNTTANEVASSLKTTDLQIILQRLKALRQQVSARC